MSKVHVKVTNQEDQVWYSLRNSLEESLLHISSFMEQEDELSTHIIGRSIRERLNKNIEPMKVIEWLQTCGCIVTVRKLPEQLRENHGEYPCSGDPREILVLGGDHKAKMASFRIKHGTSTSLMVLVHEAEIRQIICQLNKVLAEEERP